MDIYKIIIILLLVIITILIGIFVMIAYKYFIANYKTKAKHPSQISVSGLCYIHNETSSVGICSICEEDICSECVKQIDKLNLCPTHLKTYINSQWVPITNQRTTPDTPQDGVYIYQFKKNLWNTKKIPTYILNEYKINIDDDFIETYVQLYVEEGSEVTMKEEIMASYNSKPNKPLSGITSC